MRPMHLKTVFRCRFDHSVPKPRCHERRSLVGSDFPQGVRPTRRFHKMFKGCGSDVPGCRRTGDDERPVNQPEQYRKGIIASKWTDKADQHGAALAEPSEAFEMLERVANSATRWRILFDPGRQSILVRTEKLERTLNIPLSVWTFLVVCRRYLARRTSS